MTTPATESAATTLMRNHFKRMIFTGLLAGAFSLSGQWSTHSASSTDILQGSGASASGPGGQTWLTDLPKAVSQAKAEKKLVLVFFHGSDWCPPCVEMEREFFKSPPFAQFARKALVLVDVDFPVKRKQAESLRAANLAMKAKFNLSPDPGEGYPTIVLLNDEGHTLFQETGYASGSASELLLRLQRHTGLRSPANDVTAYKDLEVADFARMAADKQSVVLDVRTPDEFRAGHIPGAVNIDVSAADFQQKAAALDKSKTYLVHCASGVRSVRACEKLSRLDFPRLYNLPGGFKAWVKANQPVEK